MTPALGAEVERRHFGGQAVDDETKWLRWLRTVTRETTHRSIAKAAGVSHTTVRRWAANGVPARVAWELTIRYRADPVETLLVLGHIEADEVPRLNWRALVEYAPTVALTEETHARATTTRREYPHIKLQRRPDAMSSAAP